MKNKTELIKDIKNVISLTGENRTRFFIYMALLGVSESMLNIGFSYTLKSLIDFFIDKAQGSLVSAVASTGVVVLFGGILMPVFIYLSNSTKAKILFDVRVGLFKHMQQMPASYFESHHSGDTLSRVNKDINALEKALNTIENFTVIVISMSLAVPYILVMDYRFGLIALALGTAAMFFNIKFRMPMREKSRAVHKKSAKLVEQLTENVTGFNLIKTFNLSDRYYSKFQSSMEDVVDSELKITRINAFLYSTNALLGWFGYGGLAVIGCYWVIMGSMSPGVLMGSLQVASNITGGIVRIGEMTATIQQSFAGSDRVYGILNEETEPEAYGTPGADPGCGVAFKDARFAYVPGETVIDGLDICVEKGETAALVGYSGGGKSTAVKLMLGLYSLDSGGMTIDGKPLCEYTLEELRDRIAYVPQDAYIFDGTIRENIGYGNPDADEAEITEAAKKANAHDFIMAHEKGYDTLVGERGIRLSGGQRQRIAIARAILKDAPVLLLDEATSSLDSESESLVQEALLKLMTGKTSVVVAHRLSTVEKADVIFFISGGRVVEKGAHRQLLEQNGMYAALYNRDFATADERKG